MGWRRSLLLLGIITVTLIRRREKWGTSSCVSDMVHFTRQLVGPSGVPLHTERGQHRHHTKLRRWKGGWDMPIARVARLPFEDASCQRFGALAALLFAQEDFLEA